MFSTVRDVALLVTSLRHQQIGFITRLTLPEQRRLCKVLRLEMLPTGGDVYKEGSHGDSLYIILHGTASATTRQGGGGGHRRAQLLMGGHESEEDSEDEDDGMAALLGGARSPRAGDVSPCGSAAGSVSARGSAQTSGMSPSAMISGSGAAAGGARPQSAAPADRKLGDLVPGRHFGELALLKPGSQRTSTVVMREPSLLLRLNFVDWTTALKLGAAEQAALEAHLTRLRQCPIFQGAIFH